MSEYDWDRAPGDLEPHYSRHIMAMTREGLRSKSDIACELAYRDKRIAELEAAQPSAEPVAWMQSEHSYDPERHGMQRRLSWKKLESDDAPLYAHPPSDELEALRRDAERLNSGCIMTHERDEFGEEYRCERRGLDLRAAIDAAIARQEDDHE